MSNIKYLAFYLPQFHPIPENDEWWGKGFTEWTNVKKAIPLYKGHKQPKIPADLGYYDLRIPEIRQKQVDLAKTYGIHGFIYYHYWFGNGFQLLEGIADDVLKRKEPDFPFCFCWANETWSGRWHGLHDRILARQEYPGNDDIKQHFNYLLPFFKDSRYIKVNNKPILMVYRPLDLFEKGGGYLEQLQSMAKQNGFDGLYLVAGNIEKDELKFNEMGFDAKISYELNRVKYNYLNTIRKEEKSVLKKFISLFQTKRFLNRLNAEFMFKEIEYKESDVPTYPMVLPNWDNTPRSNFLGEVFEDTSPELFRLQLIKANQYLANKSYSQKFIVIKSWNEWAEGNYIEPDQEYGHAYLEIIKEVKSTFNG